MGEREKNKKQETITKIKPESRKGNVQAKKREHGILKKELGGKTPFEAIEKRYELKPVTFLKAI